MKVCLVSPPTVTEFEGTPAGRSRSVRAIAGQPALGVLNLAASLEKLGVKVEIFDLNQMFCDASAQGRSFFPDAAAKLLESDATVFGFSTICTTYPLTVRLAQSLRLSRPEATIVFGGPQAAAVDIETLARFPFVDTVVRGEADESFPALLGALGRPDLLECVRGITYRRAGLPTRTPDAALPDVATLPVPAYQLWPGIEDLREFPLEAGRGCPFDCTFCSTSRFFHRRYRVKPPERIVEEMRCLHRRYAVRTFHLVHDAFTVDRAAVVAFCEELMRSGCDFRWGCSARTDCVDERLLELMAAAGCIDIYFGVETGSAAVQRAIHKGLDLDQALEAIRSADRHSIKTTVSLITGFPEEAMDDLRGTIRFLMDSVRIDSVEPQLHLVAPLAGSALYEQFRGRLRWDGIFSDMALQSFSPDPADCELIRDHPDIFPNFYALPAGFDRGYLMDLRHFITYGLTHFRWLMIALEQQSGDLLDVFDRWRKRRPASSSGEYYAGPDFRRDFLDFVAGEYQGSADDPGIAIRTLLELERQRARDAAAEDAKPAQPPATGLEAFPRPAPGVAIREVHADYQAVIERLRKRCPPGNVAQQPVILAERQASAGRVDLIQLSPLAAALVRLCDGSHTAREIAAVFPSLDTGLETLPAEPACLFALNELARQGLVVFGEPVTAPC